ncbi:YbjQ family protein [Agrobacterium rubi]|nr:YbjQ family protein [Agrobacterium rubi]NTF19443.1 YbjQ family protein [Agrobacterium rubi]NTF26406.1 YbjQ family protein [Agrobacterium rubi]
MWMPKCSRCNDDFYLGGKNGYCADCEEEVAKSLSSKALESIIMTTSIDIPNRKVESVISIIASEAALGMNVFKDIANNWRDFVGGRSATSQASLKEARLACLDGLRSEAQAVGADAVIAVDLDYNQLATGGTGGILFVAATGTAVKLKPA